VTDPTTPGLTKNDQLNRLLQVLGGEQVEVDFDILDLSSGPLSALADHLSAIFAPKMTAIMSTHPLSSLRAPILERLGFGEGALLMGMSPVDLANGKMSTHLLFFGASGWRVVELKPENGANPFLQGYLLNLGVIETLGLFPAYNISAALIAQGITMLHELMKRASELDSEVLPSSLPRAVAHLERVMNALQIERNYY
jgi:hypothetical protein